jgi:hypothetical protein
MNWAKEGPGGAVCTLVGSVAASVVGPRTLSDSSENRWSPLNECVTVPIRTSVTREIAAVSGVLMANVPP